MYAMLGSRAQRKRATTPPVTIDFGKISANETIVLITGTWSNAGVNFSAPLTMTITGTAFGGASELLHLSCTNGGTYQIGAAGQQFVTYVGGDSSAWQLDCSGSSTNNSGAVSIVMPNGITNGVLLNAYRLSDPDFFFLTAYFSGFPGISIGPGSSSRDVGFFRQASNIGEVTDGHPTGTTGNLAALAVTTVNHKTYLVSGLPAAGVAGRRAFVTDATSTTFASIVAGTGGNKVPVYDDGTNWRIG